MSVVVFAAVYPVMIILFSELSVEHRGEVDDPSYGSNVLL